jgi:hypothetical protein
MEGWKDDLQWVVDGITELNSQRGRKVSVPSGTFAGQTQDLKDIGSYSSFRE